MGFIQKYMYGKKSKVTVEKSNVSVLFETQL